MALRHCVPRRRLSVSNPLSPRSKANIIPSYMLAASLSSPVLPVGSVVLPHASWPGEHLSIIHSFVQSIIFSIFLFFPSYLPPHPSLLIRLSLGLAYCSLMFRGGGGTGACTSCDAHREITWCIVSCLRAPLSHTHIVMGFPIHQHRSSPPFCLELR